MKAKTKERILTAGERIAVAGGNVAGVAEECRRALVAIEGRCKYAVEVMPTMSDAQRKELQSIVTETESIRARVEDVWARIDRIIKQGIPEKQPLEMELV